MEISSWILIVMGCYLVGSFSFARTAVRIFAPDKDIENIPIQVQGTDQTMRYNVMGGSAAGMILGKKMGLLTGILDMLKVILPTAILRFAYPAQPEIMLVGATVVTLGHVFPIFYRFKGGGGYSTIFGGLLVISPLGALVCSLGGMILGLLVFRSFALVYALQFFLLIFWMVFRFGSLPYILFAIVANILFFLRWLPPLIIYLQDKGPRRKLTLRESMEAYPMGAGMVKMLEKFRIKLD